ncbi:hypothetical protein JCM3770_004697 [Rhodotorula araucariae]
MLEPLSGVFLSLPPALSLSYAAFIPLFTLLYRSTTTLPIVLWQRRRTRRFADVVMPLLRKEQGRIALETRDECRRAAKSYDEYQAVFKKKAKKAAYALARKYRCSPRLTLILPPLTHVPIFVLATLVLRDACARAIAALGVAPSSLSALLDASPASALTSSALAHLHELASTPFLWCPSLVLPDPTMALPLAVGLAALLNVEVTARTRRAQSAAAEAVARPGDAVLPGPSSGAGPAPVPVVSASERRRVLARRARDGSPHARVRGLTTLPVRPPAPAKDGADLPRKPSNERLVTNMLRGASIAFIPLAGMAPAAVCVYWVTSNVFTLAQNLTFWWLDRGRERERRMRDIIIDLSHHLSDMAKSRLTSPLKSLYGYMQQPGMLLLAGGLPPPELFPYESITAETLAKDSFKTTDVGFGAWLWSWIAGGKKTDSWTIPKFTADKGTIQLSSALQYGTAAGLPPLAKFIHEFTERVYQPGTADYRTVINAGSTDAWGKIATTLANPGDGILCEEWTYPSALASVWPSGLKPVTIPMDGEGMTPQGMDALLAGWNPDEHGGMRRPRILYTIPVCQNPTGATMSLERKKAIYALAVKYDVIIVEDDPYYFLQAGEYEPSRSLRTARLPKKTETDDEFLKSLVPSYLRLDYQGRVVRIDTFSKTICPGSRLGWTTCNPLFAERLERANESSTQAASGFAQALVGKLLAEQWGLDGYLRWLKGIKAQYRDRRNTLVDALLDGAHASLETRQAGSSTFEYWTRAPDVDEKGFRSEKGSQKRILSFVSPQGGMFVWLRVHFAEHPSFRHKSTSALLLELWTDLAEHNVLVAPGTMFSATDFPPTPAPADDLALTEDGDGFFRIAFSTATPEQMQEAARVIGARVDKFFRV